MAASPAFDALAIVEYVAVGGWARSSTELVGHRGSGHLPALDGGEPGARRGGAA